jgi:hypothetical protein
MKYAANITRKPGGLNMASACIRCDGPQAIAQIQKAELASLKIHDEAMKSPTQKRRARNNVRKAEAQETKRTPKPKK